MKAYKSTTKVIRKISLQANQTRLLGLITENLLQEQHGTFLSGGYFVR